MKKLGIFLFILIIISTIVFYGLDLKQIILKKIYPKQYEGYVETYANKYDVDPLLILAIIKAESNFDPNAKSKSGAMGLMQLMESTAKEIAKKLEENFQEINLYEPQTSIQIGTYYFSILLKQYHGNIGLALASYNAGPRTCNRVD